MELPLQLQEIIDKLPAEVRAAVAESDYETVVDELATTHELKAPQARLLAVETVFVLAGLESAADFAESIEREAELPHETARAVANEVGLRVFSPFREKLQALAAQSDSGSATVSEGEPAPQVAPPQYKEGDPYREPIE